MCGSSSPSLHNPRLPNERYLTQVHRRVDRPAQVEHDVGSEDPTVAREYVHLVDIGSEGLAKPTKVWQGQPNEKRFSNAILLYRDGLYCRKWGASASFRRRDSAMSNRCALESLTALRLFVLLLLLFFMLDVVSYCCWLLFVAATAAEQACVRMAAIKIVRLQP